MEIKVTRKTEWSDALDMARFTVHKEMNHKEPSDKWKWTMMIAEHSPIRCVWYQVEMYDVPYCNVMHLVRHTQGIEKFVATQRSDRTGVDRNTLSQTNHIDACFWCNAQAFVNISQKRLCGCADAETRKIWSEVVNQLGKIDPVVARVCVPTCVYRGWCTELKCCGYCNTDKYKHEIINYRIYEETDN